jgi:hypothetical protein
VTLRHPVELAERLGTTLSICFQFVLQAAEADPEQACRLRPIAAHAIQRLENVLLLQLAQRQACREARPDRLGTPLAPWLPQGQHIDIDRITLT